MNRLALLLPVVACVAGVPLAAQWLNHPTPALPRTADGKPNLSAPAPRAPDGKPDLSGLWNRMSPKYSRNIAADLKPGEVLPWAEALVNERRENLGKGYMNTMCVPFGPSYVTSADTTGAEQMKIVQTPSLILILNPDLTYRQVFMDGRALEPIRTRRGWAIRSGTGKGTRWSSRATATTIGRGSITMGTRTRRRCG